MGLDMYLSKKNYVGNKYREEQQQVKVVIPTNQDKCMFPTKHIQQKRISYIIEEVAYWRKANHIHKWFVENVQNGEDDCGNYYLDHEKLQELVNECKETITLLENTPKVKKTVKGWNNSEHEVEVFDIDEDNIKLPTQSGFFFGGTLYDEYYLNDLQNTVQQLEPLLEDDTAEYEYHASW